MSGGAACTRASNNDCPATRSSASDKTGGVLLQRLGHAVGPFAEPVPVQMPDDMVGPVALGPGLDVLEGLDDHRPARPGGLQAEAQLRHLRIRRSGQRNLADVRPAAARLDLGDHLLDGFERVVEDRRVCAGVAQAMRVRAGGRGELMRVPVSQGAGGLRDRIVRGHHLDPVDQRVQQPLGRRDLLVAVGVRPNDRGIRILPTDLFEGDLLLRDRPPGAVDQQMPEAVRVHLLPGQDLEALRHPRPLPQIGQFPRSPLVVMVRQHDRLDAHLAGPADQVHRPHVAARRILRCMAVRFDNHDRLDPGKRLFRRILDRPVAGFACFACICPLQDPTPLLGPMASGRVSSPSLRTTAGAAFQAGIGRMPLDKRGKIG
jgi:hypothetical protein